LQASGAIDVQDLLGVDNDIALLNYLSSVTLSATDKD